MKDLTQIEMKVVSGGSSTNSGSNSSDSLSACHNDLLSIAFPIPFPLPCHGAVGKNKNFPTLSNKGK